MIALAAFFLYRRWNAKSIRKSITTKRQSLTNDLEKVEGSAVDKIHASQSKSASLESMPPATLPTVDSIIATNVSSSGLRSGPLPASTATALASASTSSNLSSSSRTESALVQGDVSEKYIKVFDEGEFDIGVCIGQGSFGRVYKAHWRRTEVAFKAIGGHRGVLALSDEEMETLAGNMIREASLMAEFRHPNIVQFIGVCVSPPSLITEYCSRGSLMELLRTAKTDPEKACQLSWDRRLGLLADAARGVLYLHSNTPHAVLHRDIKSPNILVSESWVAKVGDFGLSRMLEDYQARSTMGGLANPRWVAPEILSGERFSAAADVFSFGVVMWEVLSCDLPWRSINEWSIVGSVQRGQRLPIPQLQEIPGPQPSDALYRRYVSVMERCWSQVASNRPGFAAIVDELMNLKEMVDT